MRCGRVAFNSLPLHNRRESMLKLWASHDMLDAIISALMHRIPSEFRSQACLGNSSTKLGDHLRSPRVAPLFYFFYSFFQFMPILFFLCLQMATAPACTLTPITFLLPDMSVRGPSAISSTCVHPPLPRSCRPACVKCNLCALHVGCDHTSTNAPNPIRTL